MHGGREPLKAREAALIKAQGRGLKGSSIGLRTRKIPGRCSWRAEQTGMWLEMELRGQARPGPEGCGKKRRKLWKAVNRTAACSSDHVKMLLLLLSGG